ncbi:MAG: type II and III secretion system family protein [Micavibrio sp.]|nr:type II and III secretion system family protein [Micavibrio sp.]
MVVTFAAALASCQLAKNQLQYDRTAAGDRQMYRDVMAPVPTPAMPTATPDFQSVVSTPEDLKLPTPLVTVSVNQTVSLRDLMYQLAQQADVDIEMDPQIHGSLIFTAKDRPFDQVVDRICDMAGLRYNYKNNVLRVELDRPFMKTYNVEFLNFERKGSSSVTTTSTSSSSGVTNSTAPDGWKDLNDGIEQILTASDTYASLATMADPVAQVANPLPQPTVSADPNVPPPPPPLPGSPQLAPIPASQAPQLTITTPAGEPLVPSPPATFSISKQTGLISVFASQRQHKLVDRFIQEFRKRATTQVLIEAKVLQVDLTDEFATGVNWSTLNLTGLLKVTQSFPLPAFTPAASGNFGLTFEPGSDFSTAIQAISRFGTVRALSSPRVTVLNNQSAIVNVTKDNKYLDFDFTVTPATSTTAATFALDSNEKNSPEGIVLTVIPNANPDTGEIMMAVRPTVLRVTRFITDPTISLDLALNNIDPSTVSVPNNLIPQVDVQEIDSVLRIQSGQMMALGGLMQDSNTVQEEGVPVLGDVPYIGTLFRNHSDKAVKSELVIFLRASVVGGDNVDQFEKKLYQTVGEDRHPGPL